MIAIIGILFLIAAVGGAFAMRGARKWVLDAGATEVRLKDPATHALSYLVPDGQDPAALMAALAHDGVTTAMDSDGGIERLLIACEENDRALVRGVLDDANRGSSPRMGDHVVFGDEPQKAAS